MDEPPKSDEPTPEGDPAGDRLMPYFTDCTHVRAMGGQPEDLQDVPGISYVLIDRGLTGQTFGALMCRECANAVETAILPYCAPRRLRG